MDTATAHEDYNPRSIVVHYNSDFMGLVPTDILPLHNRNICWGAKHLAFEKFMELVAENFDISYTGKQVMADTGELSLMSIDGGQDWYRVMQMMHDKGLKQRMFCILGEIIMVEPQQQVEVVQQASARGWDRVATALGTFVIVGGVAAENGYIPGLPLLSSLLLSSVGQFWNSFT